MIDDKILKLREDLSKIWAYETSYFSRKKYEESGIKSYGQCYVSACIVFIIFGGKLKRARIKNDTHYWNILPDGTEIDLTSDQYDGDGIHPISEGRTIDRNKDSMLKNKRVKKLYDEYLKKR